MTFAYVARTEDGRYGLAGPDTHGHYTLWRIASPDYPVGSVMDPANLEDAADAADEEMRCLLADASAEFG
jgi:hypothetical protein